MRNEREHRGKHTSHAGLLETFDAGLGPHPGSKQLLRFTESGEGLAHHLLCQLRVIRAPVSRANRKILDRNSQKGNEILVANVAPLVIIASVSRDGKAVAFRQYSKVPAPTIGSREDAGLPIKPGFDLIDGHSSRQNDLLNSLSARFCCVAQKMWSAVDPDTRIIDAANVAGDIPAGLEMRIQPGRLRRSIRGEDEPVDDPFHGRGRIDQVAIHFLIPVFFCQPFFLGCLVARAKVPIYPINFTLKIAVIVLQDLRRRFVMRPSKAKSIFRLRRNLGLLARAVVVDQLVRFGQSFKELGLLEKIVERMIFNDIAFELDTELGLGHAAPPSSRLRRGLPPLAAIQSCASPRVLSVGVSISFASTIRRTS